FQRRAPDLVILDWMLPELDGLAVLQRIRAESFIPVLMLTARVDPADRVAGLETGADDYLVKPFNMGELIARVRALLRREAHIRETLQADQSQRVSPIQYRSLLLDPLACSCTLDGRPLELTTLEFELLSLLLTHPGRTFNRQYLVETIWQAAYIEGDRSVDNIVLRLRKKLEAMGDYLETVHGMGYRIRRLVDANPEKSGPVS
ncbi:MAG: response regulator transcription factor, partial [Anaerolineales bacterium]|nr:response regulator transcription factor [Anaerolineales bacterium]